MAINDTPICCPAGDDAEYPGSEEDFVAFQNRLFAELIGLGAQPIDLPLTAQELCLKRDTSEV